MEGGKGWMVYVHTTDTRLVLSLSLTLNLSHTMRKKRSPRRPTSLDTETSSMLLLLYWSSPSTTETVYEVAATEAHEASIEAVHDDFGNCKLAFVENINERFGRTCRPVVWLEELCAVPWRDAKRFCEGESRAETIDSTEVKSSGNNPSLKSCFNSAGSLIG